MPKKETSKRKSYSAHVAEVTSTSVTMKRVNNGYVVSTYSDRTGKEKAFIAKTEKEAKQYAEKLLKVK